MAKAHVFKDGVEVVEYKITCGMRGGIDAECEKEWETVAIENAISDRDVDAKDGDNLTVKIVWSN